MEKNGELTSTQIPASNASVRHDEASTEDVDGKAKDDQYLTGKALIMLEVALLLVVIIITLDISILATAIPWITDEFHTIKDIGWYAAAFSFTNAALQPLSGKFYTYFSVKWVFMICIAIFEVGSLVCATAPTSTALIIGRAVSGIGASGIINGALTIVGLATEPSDRPTLMGLIMSFSSAGQIAGPLIGGALTQHATWRWCFYLNLPVGAITLLFMVFIRFPDNKQKRKDNSMKSIIADFDLLGFSLFAPASIMLLLALEWGGTTYSWASSTIIGLLVAAVVGFVLFGFWERHAKDHAMFPASIITKRPIYSAILTAFTQGGSLLLLAYYLPIWFQTILNRSPVGSAVSTLPTFITQIIFAVTSGALLRRIGYLTPFAIAGVTVATIGNVLMAALFKPTTGAGQWIGFQILTGAGRGLVLQVPTQIIQTNVPRQQLSVGTAISTWAQFIGGSIFVALGQTTLSNILKNVLKTDAPNVDVQAVINAGATGFKNVVSAQDLPGVIKAYNTSITKTFYLGVGCGVVGTIVAFGMGFKKIATKKPSKEEKDTNAAEPRVTETRDASLTDTSAHREI